MISVSLFLSGSGSVSFFHCKLNKRVTPLVIGCVPSDLSTAIGQPSNEALSLALSLSLLAVLQGRVVWHDNLFSGKEC